MTEPLLPSTTSRGRILQDPEEEGPRPWPWCEGCLVGYLLQGGGKHNQGPPTLVAEQHPPLQPGEVGCSFYSVEQPQSLGPALTSWA